MIAKHLGTYTDKIVLTLFEEAVAFGRGIIYGTTSTGAYFAYADLMYFYWSDDLLSPEKLVAVWRNGELEVHNAQAMQRFVEKYETDRSALAAEGQTIPAFDSYFSKS